MDKLIYSDEREYHIALKAGDVGRYVILPGDPARCKSIASYFDEGRLVAQNREYTTYSGYVCGELVSVVSTGIGGPSAAIALEELVHIGADTFIRVGSAGGMAEQVKAGDIVIATGAVRCEGTSREYAPVEYPAVADFDVVSALRRASADLKTSVHLGVVQSKDSFYGQHSPDSMPIADELKRRWEAWLRCGALASEMETAALFIVGAARRVRVGSVLSVIGNQTRREKGLEEQQNYDISAAAETAVKAIKLMIQSRKSV